MATGEQITENDTAVLVLSCDRYKDAWAPFFTLFRKYWPNCPYPVYLGANQQEFQFSGVQTILSGPPVNWTVDMQNLLSQIKEKYIIILLEDYFLTAKVDGELLEKCLEVTRAKNAVFTRLASFRADHFQMYEYDVIPDQSFIGITRHTAQFRINLQAGIWNKSDLISLLNGNESPWEFEVHGSERTINMDRTFLGVSDKPNEKYVHGPIPYLCTAITKGVWMREAITLCNKEKISLDITARPVESLFEYGKRRIYHGLSFGSRKYLDYIAFRLRSKKKE